MNEALFAIRNGARRKKPPCAFLRYADDEGFKIDIEETVSPDDVPAFFVPFVQRGEYHIPPDLSLRWVRERIPPPGRQNLGEILNAHGLNEYSEIALLRSGRGGSSQDSFIVEELSTTTIDEGFVDQAAMQRKKLGEGIKARRTSLKMSQRELADAVGIDQPALSKIEAGKSNITFDLLSAIDGVVSGAGTGILHQTPRVLWNERRRRIQGTLEDHTPDLSQTYRRLVNELEAYDENTASSIADSRIISHCFREIMDSFSVYIDGFSPKGMQGAERAATDKVLQLLERQPLSPGEAQGLTAITPELHSALAKMQEAHHRGSQLNAHKMKVSVSGAEDSASAPISAWKKVHDLASGTAHLPRQRARQIPSFKEYADNLEILENILEGRIGSIYKAKEMLWELIHRANRVDASGSFSHPREDEVESFVSLLSDSNLRSLAFRELKNPLWLEALEASGFFKAYSELDGSAFTPLHPAPFLLLCLKTEQKRVISLLLDLSKNEWPSAREFLIGLCNELPDDDLKPVAHEITRWAKQGYGIGSYCWQRCNIESLLSRMLESDDPELSKQGLTLFQQLVRIRKNTLDAYPYEEISSCIPEYHYDQFVRSLMPMLSLNTRMMMIRNMINQYVQPLDKGRAPLPSRVIAYSLEETALKEALFRKRLLAPWIKECKQAFRDALQDDPKRVLHKLFEQTPLILRCMMSALHEHIEAHEGEQLDADTRDVLTHICFNGDILFDDEYELEIMPLLADFAHNASASDRNRFLHSIMGWLDAWEKDRIKNGTTDDPERYERKKELMAQAILSSFPMQMLPDYLQEVRRELETKRGVYAGPCELYKATAIWGPNSPLDADDFQEMGPEATLEWLHEWAPSESDRIMLVEHEGVARTLTTLIEASPSFFDGCFADLRKQKLIYLTGMIDGWRSAVKASRAIPLDEVIDLCSFIMTIQSDSCDAASGYERTSEGIDEAMQHIAWLLVKILESSEIVINSVLAHDILMILLELRERGLMSICQDASWADDDDCVTASLNMLGSVALSGIVQWIAREEPKDSQDSQRAFDALECALPDSDVSKADIAAFALKAPHLLRGHRDWLDARYEKLFGKHDTSDGQRLFLALQISIFNMTPTLFGFLEPALKVALATGMEHFPATMGISGLNGFAECLGFGLFQLYAAGEIDIENDLLALWLKRTEPLTIGNVLAKTCAIVHACPDTTEEIAGRVQLLWDYLACRHDARFGVLHGAFSLAASQRYPHDWQRKALLEETQARDALSDLNIHFDAIHILATEDPEWGIALLRTVIENDAERDAFAYDSMPHSLIELYRKKNGKASSVDVTYCMDELGRMGILDLDLI